LKKQRATDVKRAAGNDVEKDEATKSPKAPRKTKAPKPDQRYELGSVATVKRGFLLALVEWARKRKAFTAAQAIEEFNGRQFTNRKVDAGRVTRYFNYCRVHGIFRLLKNGGAK